MNNIQTIQAPTLGEFETVFNQVFPDMYDDNLEIIKNVHPFFDKSSGRINFKAIIRKK